MAIDFTFYTVDEVASILKLTRETILKNIYAGNLRASKIAGSRVWRIREIDIHTFLEMGENTPIVSVAPIETVAVAPSNQVFKFNNDDEVLENQMVVDNGGNVVDSFTFKEADGSEELNIDVYEDGESRDNGTVINTFNFE